MKEKVVGKRYALTEDSDESVFGQGIKFLR